MPDIVSLAIDRCGLPMAGGASYSGAVVGVAVADDGVVPGCPGGGAPQLPAWSSTLQVTMPSRAPRSGETSPMEGVAWRPQ